MPVLKTQFHGLGEYVSLFEYLQKPAGRDLGKEVFNYSKEINLPIKFRDIENPKYKGKVCLYPRGFLKLYFFSENNNLDIVDEPKIDDSLSF
jgi:hypothetical protein